MGNGRRYGARSAGGRIGPRGAQRQAMMPTTVASRTRNPPIAAPTITPKLTAKRKRSYSLILKS